MLLTIADGTSCHPGDICAGDTSFSNNGTRDFRCTWGTHGTSNVNNDKLVEQEDLNKHILRGNIFSWFFIIWIVDCFFYFFWDESFYFTISSWFRAVTLKLVPVFLICEILLNFHIYCFRLLYFQNLQYIKSRGFGVIFRIVGLI